MTEAITVGDATRPAGELVEYAKMYLQTPETYAYPAYDGYQGGDPDEIEECDLLAIELLNAGQNPITPLRALAIVAWHLGGQIRKGKRTS